MKLLKIIIFTLALILGNNELANSQYWGNGFPIHCCTYTPNGVDDYAVTVTACWVPSGYYHSTTECPCVGRPWGTVQINGVTYQIEYISCYEINSYCCMQG